MKLVFDVETNGLNYRDDVLSFSALLIDDGGEIVKEIDRYYFPESGHYNLKAVSVNGLTEETIEKKRSGATYPEFFSDDQEVADLFCIVDELIAHNIRFDVNFVEYHLDLDLSKKKKVCTMLSTQYLYDAPYENYGEPKWPKLSEAAAWAEIDTSKFESKGGFHSSLFDVYCTYEIYRHLAENGYSLEA